MLTPLEAGEAPLEAGEAPLEQAAAPLEGSVNLSELVSLVVRSVVFCNSCRFLIPWTEDLGRDVFSCLLLVSWRGLTLDWQFLLESATQP